MKSKRMVLAALAALVSFNMDTVQTWADQNN